MFSGLDPWRVLESTDPIEAMIVGEMITTAQLLKGKERQDLANRIANALNGGKG